MTDTPSWTCPDCGDVNRFDAPHCSGCGVVRDVPQFPQWAIDRVFEWRTKFKTIDRNANPDGVDLRRWRRFLNDCAVFLNNGRCLQAIEMGWDEYQLFAADRLAPIARCDHLGALWFVKGTTISEVTPTTIVMNTKQAPLTYYAKEMSLQEIRLPWDPAAECPTDGVGEALRGGNALAGTQEPKTASRAPAGSHAFPEREV